MTTTALKSADELKQFILTYLKANTAGRVKKHFDYFRISTHHAPSVKPENSFVTITLHPTATEIARNVNDERADSETHGDMHISNDELLRFKAQWQEAQTDKGFVSHQDIVTYRVDSFLSLVK